jgi:hypothetical protein
MMDNVQGIETSYRDKLIHPGDNLLLITLIQLERKGGLWNRCHMDHSYLWQCTAKRLLWLQSVRDRILLITMTRVNFVPLLTSRKSKHISSDYGPSDIFQKPESYKNALSI